MIAVVLAASVSFSVSFAPSCLISFQLIAAVLRCWRTDRIARIVCGCAHMTFGEGLLPRVCCVRVLWQRSKRVLCAVPVLRVRIVSFLSRSRHVQSARLLCVRPRPTASRSIAIQRWRGTGVCGVRRMSGVLL